MKAVHDFGNVKAYGDDAGVAWETGAKVAIRSFLFLKEEGFNEEEIDAWFSGFQTACELYTSLRDAENPEAAADLMIRENL